MRSISLDAFKRNGFIGVQFKAIDRIMPIVTLMLSTDTFFFFI